jgi:hypothetical protein
LTNFVFNPLHYLPLLEQKIGALDQSAPLIGWDLREEFATLRRLIEARMGKRGKRTARHDGALLPELIDKDNTAGDVWADQIAAEQLEIDECIQPVPARHPLTESSLSRSSMSKNPV